MNKIDQKPQNHGLLNRDINMEEAQYDNQDSAQKISIEHILSRIDKIIEDNDHIKNALAALTGKGSDDSYDYPRQPCTEAITRIVLARETTNQQILSLLEKMYNDISGRNKAIIDYINDNSAIIACVKALESAIENNDVDGEVFADRITDLY